jgi:L-ascorbate metabolism protein UlaG (beta-lactamase superfamily)
MRIKYLGHAAFLLTASDGTRIVTDPYQPGAFRGGIIYGPIGEPADFVTVSHDHLDHNDTAGVPGKPKAIRSSGSHKAGGVSVAGFDCFHDDKGGAQRGRNVIFVFEDAGLRLAHLGDLGHLPVEQARAMGRIDVALVPVGGYFTIDAETAHKTAELLGARVVIPMHFKTGKANMPVAGVEDFLKDRANVKRVGGSEVEVNAGSLPASPEIWVLEHAL